MGFAWRLLLLVALLATVSQVAAHAEPWSSIPADRERLADSPENVTVVFNEPIYADGSWVTVRDLSGNRVDLDNLEVTLGDRPTMTIGLPPLEDGPYLVHWQTYSQVDGHTIRDAFGFSVGGFTPPEGLGTADDIPSSAAFARFFVYFGYTAALGALVFEYMILRRDVTNQRGVILDGFVMGGALVHFIGLLWLLSDTIIRSGIGPIGILTGPSGVDWWFRILIALALVLLTGLWNYGPVRPQVSTPLLATLWITAVAAGAQFGHGGTPTAWFVQTLHALSIAAWIGALLVLVLVLLFTVPSKKTIPEIQQIGERFGTTAVAAVALAAFSGLMLSLIVAGASVFDPRLWFTDSWRVFLGLKITFTLAMVALAIINREVFLSPKKGVAKWRQAIRNFAQRKFNWQRIEDSGSTKGLRIVVAVEAFFGVAILVCAGFLMSVGAPANIPEPVQPSITIQAVGTNFTAELTMEPQPAEDHVSDIRIVIQHLQAWTWDSANCQDGDVLKTDCVRMEWWQRRAGNETARNQSAVPDGETGWLFSGVPFNQSGVHVLRIIVEGPDGMRDELRANVNVLRSQEISWLPNLEDMQQ